MKTYSSEKFTFLNKKLENGDFYYRYEIKFIKRFPFIFNEIIAYKLIDEIWIEQIEL